MPPWYMIFLPYHYESSVFFCQGTALALARPVVSGRPPKGHLRPWNLVILPQIQLKTSMVHQCSSSSMRNVGNHQGSRAWYCLVLEDEILVSCSSFESAVKQIRQWEFDVSICPMSLKQHLSIGGLSIAR